MYVNHDSNEIFRCPGTLFITHSLLFLGPSKITAKMAFLPPKITYNMNEVEQTDETGEPSKDKEPKYEFSFSQEVIDSGISMDEAFMKEYFDVFYTKTKRGHKIACLYIRNPNPKDVKYTLLFSHGNAADLGMLTGFYCRLVHQLKVNLFSYDYSGYGRSKGKPTEKNLYSDIEAAWHELLKRYDIKPENVILYGQSIGTAPGMQNVISACAHDSTEHSFQLLISPQKLSPPELYFIR